MVQVTDAVVDVTQRAAHAPHQLHVPALSRLSDRPIEFFGLALGIFFLVAATLDRRLSTDVFWSLTAGQSILAHHSLFGVNAFTYTEPHRRWIADEWGSEVALATLFKWFGSAAFNLFAIGTGALCLIATRAYLRALGARGGRVALTMVLLALGIFSVTTQDRGLSFSLLWLPLELLVLTKARAAPRWLWWLPPLFVCWVNTHGSILLGLGVLALELLWSVAPDRLVAACRGVGRSTFPGQLGLAALGALAASCLSPYGPSLLRYDVGVSFNSQIGQYIQEWASPNFHSFSTLLTFCVPMAVLLVALRGRRLMLLEATLTVVLALGTLHATRFVVYLFIAACGLAATLPARRPWGDRTRRIVAALSVAAVVGLASAPAVPAGSVTTDTPVQAFDYLSAHPGRVFTEYAWGDYSVLRHRATFADGRTDYFSGAVLAAFFNITNMSVNPDPVLARYGVSYVVWQRGAPLARYLEHDPAWKIVDRTPQALVFGRTATGAPRRNGSRPGIVLPSAHERRIELEDRSPAVVHGMSWN